MFHVTRSVTDEEVVQRLEALRKYVSVTEMAQASGMHRRTMHRVLKRQSVSEDTRLAVTELLYDVGALKDLDLGERMKAAKEIKRRAKEARVRSAEEAADQGEGVLDDLGEDGAEKDESEND